MFGEQQNRSEYWRAWRKQHAHPRGFSRQLLLPPLQQPSVSNLLCCSHICTYIRLMYDHSIRAWFVVLFPLFLVCRIFYAKHLNSLRRVRLNRLIVSEA